MASDCLKQLRSIVFALVIVETALVMVCVLTLRWGLVTLCFWCALHSIQTFVCLEPSLSLSLSFFFSFLSDYDVSSSLKRGVRIIESRCR